MSTNVGSIHYDLDLNTSGFDKAMKGVGSKLKSVGRSMTDTGKKMTVGLTLPIAIGAGIAVKAASDLNENINKVSVAFKNNSKEVLAWSKTSINAMGLAQSSALDAAALFGDMATSMGLTTKQAAKMSMSMVQLGADLASFKNISFAEAQTALAGIFTGETESLKRLGIVMTETNLLEYARAQGITKTIQEMTQAEKVQLRYNYVMEKTKNAQGDFNRTSSGTANQIRITQERFKELSAQLGARLLPVANELLKFLQDLMKTIGKLTPKQQEFASGFLAIVAAMGPLLTILGTVVRAVGSLIPLFANPVFLIISGIMAAIAAVAYLVYKNWEKISPVVKVVIDRMRELHGWLNSNVYPIIKVIANFVIGQFKKAWDDLRISFQQLWVQLQPFMPQIKQLAKLIGGALLASLVVIIGTLASLVVAFAVVVSAVARVIGWISRFNAAISGAVSRVVGAVRSMSSNFSSLPNRIASAVSRIPSIFSNIMSRAVSIVWKFYGRFVDAGWGMMRAFANGIIGASFLPYNAAKSALNKVKNLLPGSDAKEGPLSKLTHSGNMLSETFAKGITQKAKSVYEAVKGSLMIPENNMTNGLSAAVNMKVKTAKDAAMSKVDSKIVINIGTIQDRADADYILNKLNVGQNVNLRGGSVA